MKGGGGATTPHRGTFYWSDSEALMAESQIGQTVKPSYGYICM